MELLRHFGTFAIQGDYSLSIIYWPYLRARR
jgi:hypothetical protein